MRLSICAGTRGPCVTARPTESAEGYTKFMLVSDTEEHNIEVFVLREFLKDSMGIDFKVRTKD